MTLSEFLTENVTDLFTAVRLSDCRITKERLIASAPAGCHAIMLAVPYPKHTGGTLASFAMIPDYHSFFAAVGEKITKLFGEKYRGAYFAVFADHSPIDERLAACTAGLGVMGDNGLLITEKYGSYVFLGEIVTSLTEEELLAEGISVELHEIKRCSGCGKCSKSCPAGCIGGDKSLCASALTQKKGTLSDIECDIIKKSGYIWGCDRCAEACPMNVGRGNVRSAFFGSGAAEITYGDIEKMSDEEYSAYPFSWRKKDVIRRNHLILSDITENGEAKHEKN